MRCLFPVLILAAACTRSRGPEPAYQPTALSDSALYAEAAERAGFGWYRGDSTRRKSLRGSGHLAWMRVRYNATALAALTDSGRLPRGAAFPAGSLMVKELFADSVPGAPLALLAVMKKEPGNPYADSGWVWAEYLPGLTADYVRLDGKGAACVGCHYGSANRDGARVFDAL